jgi:hypothetical protein
MNWKMNQHCVIHKKLNHIAGKSLAVARANHIRQLAVIFCLAVNVNAQASFPKGKAQLIEFSNDSADFKVPEGKTWVIYSMFSEHTVISPSKSYLLIDIRIFLKNINGDEKTNHTKNIYGPLLYWSSATRAGLTSVPYPIIFPEKTSFSLIILKGSGPLDRMELHNGKAYISLIEIGD